MPLSTHESYITRPNERNRKNQRIADGIVEKTRHQHGDSVVVVRLSGCVVQWLGEWSERQKCEFEIHYYL